MTHSGTRFQVVSERAFLPLYWNWNTPFSPPSLGRPWPLARLSPPGTLGHPLSSNIARFPPFPDFRACALEHLAGTEALQQTLTKQLEKALAEARRYVQGTGDVRHSLIVTGDHNMVTQVFHTYFGGDYTPLADLSLRNFLNGRVEVESLTPADRALVEEMAERTREAHRHIADHYIRLAAGE